jgi:hypothetical protein
MATRISIDKGEGGFEPFMVVFAASSADNQWHYHTLVAGTDSAGLGVSDPDNFCVYNAVTRKILWMKSTTPVRGGHIFRIHDTTKARISKATGEDEPHVVAFGGLAGLEGIHQCVGSAIPFVGGELKAAGKEALKIDSLGLEYPWALPKHIAYESKANVQWSSP